MIGPIPKLVGKRARLGFRQPVCGPRASGRRQGEDRDAAARCPQQVEGKSLRADAVGAGKRVRHCDVGGIGAVQAIIHSP
jgi:hypothetical protein